MENNNKIENLESLIAREKENLAREYFDDVWEDAMTDGIDAAVIAEALVEGAMTALTQAHGEQFAQQFADRMHESCQNGNFHPGKVLQ